MTSARSTPVTGRIPPPPAPAGVEQLDAPPTLPSSPGGVQNLLATAVPLVGSLGSVAFIATTGGGSTTSYVAGGLFLLASVAFVGASIWRSRSGRTGQATRSRRDYLDYLAQLRVSCRDAGRAQRAHLGWIHPDPSALAVLAADGTRVWERSPVDDDWLVVRYGLGAQPLGLALERPESPRSSRAGLDPVCSSALERLLEVHGVQHDLPSAVPLTAFARVEITCVDPGPARALARALVVSAATFHAPGDLVVAVLGSPSAVRHWEWAKWLPHAASGRDRDAAGPRRLVATGLADLVSLLPVELAERGRHGTPSTNGRSDGPHPPHVLVVVDDVELPHDHLVVPPGGVQGVTVVDLPHRWGEVAEPSRLRLHLEADPGAVGGPVRVTAVRPGEEPVHGVADQLSAAGALAVARRLAPHRHERGGAGPGDTSSTATPGLLDLLELPALRGLPETPDPTDQTDLTEPPWPARLPRDLLRVPIGVGPDGTPVELDLKESAQGGMGPHGLVVGATGSGKSELLRTLVLGLTLTHSPEILNLVLVDFKGGATFAGMAGMPHVSAIITNLADELTLVDRMHDAVAGEMTRRQELLRSSGNFASVRDYERARTGGERPELSPLPSLLVVCDEFSELLTAKPELVDLFVAIGRLGRSLGIHLLLASQRLEEGRLRGLDSHLSYRIGLRTFSASESRSVIGSPDAYELPAVPGLGYLRTDPTTLQRFSAAYVSGPHEPVDRDGDAEVAGGAHTGPLPFRAVRVETPYGASSGDRPPPPDQPQHGERTDRQPTVFDLAVAAMEGRGPSAHQVWLPPLTRPETLDTLLPDLAVDPRLGLTSARWRAHGPLRFPVGLVDRPRDQRRDRLACDLSGAGGHLAVVGGPRSGKSTLLRTVVASLALTHTPLELQVYVLDFGGGTFAGLRDLLHVSGVGSRSEPDVVARIVAEFASVIDAREAYFRAQGIDGVETYRRRRTRGEADDGWGDVVLVVDGWGTLRADFPELETQLQTLAQRSLTFGGHLVTSATRWMDFRAGVRDVLGTRVELRLGDTADSEVDRRLAAQVPLERPGRGIVATRHHVLVALPRVDGQASGADLAVGVADLVARVRTAWTGPPGPRLRLLPAVVPLTEVRAAASGSRGVLLGIDEKALAPVELDVAREPHLLVLGEAGSGKSSLLRTYLQEVTRRHTPDEAQVFLVDYRRAHLAQVDAAYVADYATSAPTATELARGLAAVLTARLPGPDVTPEQLRGRSWWRGKEAYVVVDDYELVATGSGNPLEALLPLLPQAVDIGLHLVLARRSGGAGRLFDPVVTMLKDLAQPGVLLSGDPGEGPLLGPLRAQPSAPGRGRLLSRDGVDVVQVALWTGQPTES